MYAVLEQNFIAEAVLEKSDSGFGTKIGILGTLFGCWHTQLSRPVTTKHASYRSCLDCGARKQFDPRTLQTSGPYFYPPSVAA